jgi:exodeoxyribonuclease V
LYVIFGEGKIIKKNHLPSVAYSFLSGMLKNHIFKFLSEGLAFDLTNCQRDLLNDLSEFIVRDPDDYVYIVKGYAGTGKTTMINQLVKTLGKFRISSVLLAPTGRAAKVLMSYTGKPSYTIHKKIYRQKSSSDGAGVFVLDKNLHKTTFFIVDEASMISNQTAENSVFGSGRLLDDLLEFVYSGAGCRLILVGDTAQLPPVGLSLSPALDREALVSYGFNVIESELTEVVRQESDSGVLYNATALRLQIGDENPVGPFRIETGSYPDLERISGGELIEKISWSYDRHGIFDTIVLTRSNKRANLYNKGIRTSILFRDSEISRGDLLMIVKNNYYWAQEAEGIEFIANGDIAEVIHIFGFEDLYGFRFADISLRFIDYDDIEIRCKIILDTLNLETAALPADANTKLFYAISEDFADIKNKKERWKKIRENPYYNALQVKFAYAITCHKAQGGQWKAVFIDTGYLSPEMFTRDFYRWLYTAFTRSVEKLYLVNFDKSFFVS